MSSPYHHHHRPPQLPPKPKAAKTVTTSTGGASSPQPSRSISSSSSSSHNHHHHEDRLQRTWRSLISSVVVSSQKAERVSETSGSQQQALKELDDAVMAFLRTRVEWGRLISYLEAKLEGTAEEMETLQHFHASQPKLGGNNKRKRSDDDEEK